MALLRQMFWLLLAVLFFLFWARAFLTGERGYLAWREMNAEISALEVQLQQLEGDNARMEARIRGLSPETLDLDYLSELVRQQSFVAGENEYLLILPQN